MKHFSDMESNIIPENDNEKGELCDIIDHPLQISHPPTHGQPIDDEIYEEFSGIYCLVIHLKIFGLLLHKRGCVCGCVC